MKRDETGVRRTSHPPLKPRSYERGFLFYHDLKLLFGLQCSR